MIDYKKLVKEAFAAQKKAYAPYSNWVVGAALLTKEGKIYHGCNIENNTFTPTVCAERVALFKAVSEGERNFVAIAIVGNDVNTPVGSGDYLSPCGVCRQVMTEFCPADFQIILGKTYDDYKVYTLAEMMPVMSLPLTK